ncbi:MAG TPA: AAA family ATPase [Thermoanaerobaculia bacterium]|jgi:predicted ATPase|nr:AAA family ATPase [Thermoanaerobaculia bacterium]
MLQSFTVRNFKSFGEPATLHLAPLTVLIGANASGKSNYLEAMQLLSWTASGRRLTDLLYAIREQELSLRGGLADLPHQGGWMSYSCDFRGKELFLKLDLQLGINRTGMRIFSEFLHDLGSGSSVPLYKIAEPAHPRGNEISIAYNNFARGGKKPRILGIDQQPVFTQLTTPARFTHAQSRREIPLAAALVRADLANILFLDPSPRRMRGYGFKEEQHLSGDGAALSAVLFRLCQDSSSKEFLLDFIRSLPEQDISDITFLETTRNEVMVQLHETFGGQARVCDAALLSDGTLRVLAVAAALLSVAEGTTVVIEEIDNGVHPSRAELLLKNIRDVAARRNLSVLLTTHNPALLDAIPIEAIPAATACYRDPASGESRLVRLQDLARYPELIAQGPVGRLVTKGILDRYLKMTDDEEARVQRDLAWVDDLARIAS